LLLVGDSRSSERDTEAIGHWLDTVDRQSRSTEMSGDWFDTVNRQRRRAKMFCYWLETVDRQRGILRRLVTGLTQ